MKTEEDIIDMAVNEYLERRADKKRRDEIRIEIKRLESELSELSSDRYERYPQSGWITYLGEKINKRIKEIESYESV